MKWSIGFAGATAAGVFLAPGSACAQSDARPWSVAVTPYLWLPAIDATLRYSASTPGGGKPEVGIESKPHDYLGNLNAAFMIAGEARNGRLSLFSDLIYLDFKSEASAVRAVDFGGGRVPVDSSLNANTRSRLKGFAWSALVGYSLEHSPDSTHDAFAGVRYLGLEAETGWQLATVIQGPGAGQVFDRSGSVSQREDLWDAVVGLRGRLTLGDGHWAVPYCVDVGTGSSRLTWQAAAGVTYAYGWGDVGLVYRYLSYERTGGKLVSKLAFGGPALGATFRF